MCLYVLNGHIIIRVCNLFFHFLVYIYRMAERIDVRFNYRGTWELVDNKLRYFNGEVDVVYDFDPDYMCY